MAPVLGHATPAPRRTPHSARCCGACALMRHGCAGAEMVSPARWRTDSASARPPSTTCTGERAPMPIGRRVLRRPQESRCTPPARPHLPSGTAPAVPPTDVRSPAARELSQHSPLRAAADLPTPSPLRRPLCQRQRFPRLRCRHQRCWPPACLGPSRPARGGRQSRSSTRREMRALGPAAAALARVGKIGRPRR